VAEGGGVGWERGGRSRVGERKGAEPVR
jgi:hypothetical protein